jgi:hypothetical protein
MKKTISGKTVNVIMDSVWGSMIVFRIAYFILLIVGIVRFCTDDYRSGCIGLMVAAILGGIVSPALVGAYNAANKNLDEQEADEKIRLLQEQAKRQEEIVGYYIVNGRDQLRQSIHSVHAWVDNPAEATVFKDEESAASHIAHCRLSYVRIVQIKKAKI